MEIHAELTGFPNRSHRPRRTDDGLGRHAADVEAIAAHEMFLDERDLRTESHRTDGGNQSCCAAADDDKIVARRGRGIFPVRRMDVGDKFLIVRVPRLDGWLRLLAHEIVSADLHFAAVTHEVENRRACDLFQNCAADDTTQNAKQHGGWRRGSFGGGMRHFVRVGFGEFVKSIAPLQPPLPSVFSPHAADGNQRHATLADFTSWQRGGSHRQIWRRKPIPKSCEPIPSAAICGSIDLHERITR